MGSAIRRSSASGQQFAKSTSASDTPAVDLRKRVPKSKHWSASEDEQLLAAAIVDKADVSRSLAPIGGAVGLALHAAIKAFKKRDASGPLVHRLDDRMFLVLSNQRLSIHSVTMWSDRPGKLIHEWRISDVDEVEEASFGGKGLSVRAGGVHLRLRCGSREPREQMASAFRISRQGFG